MKIIPNWCNNFLVVEQTNKSKKANAQLKQFISDIRVEGEIMKMEDAETYREKFLKDNFEKKYRDDAEKFVKHSEMPIIEFMAKVAQYTYKFDKKHFVTGEKEFSMEKLFPTPEELMSDKLESYEGEDAEEKDKLRAEALKKYGHKSWYDWRCENWGTKWDVCCEDIDSDANSENDELTYVSYRFDTAWSPPVEFLKNIYKKYPLLNFRLNYSEPGVAFEGDLEIEAGEITVDETREYSGDDDEDEEMDN